MTQLKKIISMTHIKSEYFHDLTKKLFMTHIKSEYFHDFTQKIIFMTQLHFHF